MFLQLAYKTNMEERIDQYLRTILATRIYDKNYIVTNSTYSVSIVFMIYKPSIKSRHLRTKNLLKSAEPNLACCGLAVGTGAKTTCSAAALHHAAGEVSASAGRFVVCSGRCRVVPLGAVVIPYLSS